jgi:hypothetical protein
MPNSPTPNPSPKTKPVNEVRIGNVKAAIWKNDTANGARYNVTFERLYTTEGKWHSTGSFGRDDLLLLAKVADAAHTWVTQYQKGDEKQPDSREGPTEGLSGRTLPRRPKQ